jgi:hypothetical protein
MKRIGRYLITAVGLTTLGGAPSLFARDIDYGRGHDRREDRREFRRDERRYDRHYDRDDFYRYRYIRRDWR